MIRKHILLFQRIIPYYRVPIFKKLYQKSGAIVCHSKERENASLKSASQHLDYPTEILARTYIGRSEMSAFQNVLLPLKKYTPKIVTVEFSLSYLSFWVLLFLKRIFKYKLIYWTHGFTHKIDEPFFSSKGSFAKYIYKFADAIICYSDERKQLLEQNVRDCPPVFVAYNTIETETLLELYKEFDNTGKDSIKLELGWKEKFHLVYIGRLTKDKRIDLLLEAFKELNRTETSVALHIIGDGPEKGLLENYKELPVYYYGENWDEVQSGKIIYAADYCFNPGYIGLSIVHCFSLGTPVITCKTTSVGPFHSPEIDYLIDNYNGQILEGNKVDLASKIKLLLKEDLIRTLSSNAYWTAANKCSSDRMVNGFLEAFRYCGADLLMNSTVYLFFINTYLEIVY